jgi:hypothetical protein
MLPRCSFLLVALSASIAASPQAQTSSPATQSIPTFKAKARLVLVDVVVTNNRREPVGFSRRGPDASFSESPVTLGVEFPAEQ